MHGQAKYNWCLLIIIRLKRLLKTFYIWNEYVSKVINLFRNALKLRNTNFDNPHGLANRFTYSTAHDISIMCVNCLQNEIFKKIINT